MSFMGSFKEQICEGNSMQTISDTKENKLYQAFMNDLISKLKEKTERNP